MSQPEGGDEAIWDYVAQCIVRGQAPYRDVVEIKAPLSAYLSAASILIGRSAGMRDVIAVRLLNVLMVGSLAEQAKPEPLHTYFWIVARTGTSRTECLGASAR